MSVINSPLFFTLLMILCFGYYCRELKKLCQYITKVYPDEWAKLSNNTMGETSWKGAAINLKESIKVGYLSTIEDEQVSKFKRMERWVVGTLLIFTTYKILSGFYFAFTH